MRASGVTTGERCGAERQAGSNPSAASQGHPTLTTNMPLLKDPVTAWAFSPKWVSFFVSVPLLVLRGCLWFLVTVMI